MKTYIHAVAGGLMLLSFAVSAQSIEQQRQYKNALYHVHRIDMKYVTERNVVQDYPHYHLRKPADGHEWIRYMSDTFVLVNTKSGIIETIQTRENIPPEAASQN